MKGKHSRTDRFRGGILALSAMCMTMLCGTIALSIDVGHIFVVRQELKKAADAASLAGASYLFPTTADGKPNWTLAEQKASEAVSWNTADGKTLSAATIETGYWDLTGQNGMRTPNEVPNPGANDLPAVRVAISRESGQNGGPVTLFFGSIVGVPNKDVGSQSVSGSGSPSAVEEHSLFPMVLPQTLYNQYWDFTAQKPKIDPSTGQPYVFNIGLDGTNGQWTSFDVNANDVPTIQNLMSTGNPTQIAIGDPVYVTPGVKTSIYSSVPSNIDVSIAILSTTLVGGATTVVGFGSMHIHYATGGNTKAVTVSLTENVKTNGGSPGGYYYGSYVPPKLVH